MTEANVLPEVIVLLHEVASIEIRIDMEKALGWSKKRWRLPTPKLDLFAIKQRGTITTNTLYFNTLTIWIPISGGSIPKSYRILMQESSSWERIGKNKRKWEARYNQRSWFSYEFSWVPHDDIDEAIDLFYHQANWQPNCPTACENINFPSKTGMLAIMYDIEKWDFSLKGMQILCQGKVFGFSPSPPCPPPPAPPSSNCHDLPGRAHPPL